MHKFESYIFNELFKSFLGAFFSLTAIALLSQSLSQFELIVERGQSVWTFLKVISFSLPQLSGVLFPLALLISILLTLSRLNKDNEIISARSSGVSLNRINLIVMRLAIYTCIFSYLCTLFLQPLANRAMRIELYNVKNDLVSTMFKEGEFSTSNSDLTIYVQSVDQNSKLKQIFIRRIEDGGRDRTYSAREGQIIVKNGKTVIFMIDGSSQILNDDNVLEHLTFKNYNIDITPYLRNNSYIVYKQTDKYLHELFYPNLEHPESVKDKNTYIAEAHSRLSAPLHNISFAILAFYAVLGGTFSRNSNNFRVFLYSGLAISFKILGVVITEASSKSPEVNIIQYLLPLLIIFIIFNKILKNDGLEIFKNKKREISYV